MKLLTSDSLVELLQKCMDLPKRKGCIMFWSKENYDGFLEAMKSIEVVEEFNIKRFVEFADNDCAIEWNNLSTLHITLGWRGTEIDGRVQIIAPKYFVPSFTEYEFDASMCLYDDHNSGVAEWPPDECQQTLSIQDLFNYKGVDK